MTWTETAREKGFWAMEQLRGNPIGKHVKDIAEWFDNPSSKDELINYRLEAILDHASKTTEFYEPYRGIKDLQRFPVIQKADIRKRYNAFLSKAYRKEQLVPVATSGSYGTPLVFYLTKEKKMRQKAEALFFNQWAGYKVGMKYLLTGIGTKKSKINPLIQNHIYMDTIKYSNEALEKYRTVLKTKGIRFIIGYPSIVSALAKYCRGMGDTTECFKLEGVICFAEVLFDTVRKDIEEAFGCRVLSRYGAMELGILGQECQENKKHHLNLASYVIEILSMDGDYPAKPGEIGRIVVTDPFSHGMPLIRYDTGDLAVMGHERCCSIDTPILERLDGRVLETIFDTKGSRVYGALIGYLARGLHNILQFQFIQEAPGTYTMMLHVLKNFQEEKTLEGRLKKYLGEDAVIKFEYVDSIPPLKSGKRPFITNKMCQSV